MRFLITVTDITLFHNPRCSKSRATLALLEAEGLTFTVHLYLETPLSEQALLDLADQLIDGEETILRTEDAAKVEPDVDPSSLTLDERIALIVRHPELMQRPIVQLGDQAKIGRPPESVLELFKV
jgi:arsenate reductase